MKTLIFSLAALSFGNLASAANLSCNGRYFWVRFAAQATVSDRAVTSAITIKVTGAPGGPKTWALAPTTSLVSPGQAISFTAQAPEGGGSMQATYNGSEYVGTINANTSYGNFNVPVTCVISKGAR